MHGTEGRGGGMMAERKGQTGRNLIFAILCIAVFDWRNLREKRELRNAFIDPLSMNREIGRESSFLTDIRNDAVHTYCPIGSQTTRGFID